MPGPLPARRLLRDSLPIPVILANWVLPTRFVTGEGEQALLVAGLGMVALYVVVRGAAVASDCPQVVQPAGLLDLLEENLRVLAVAAVWLLAALVLRVADGVFHLVPFLENIHTLRDSPFLEVVLFSLYGAAAGTVLLYVVAVGRARLAAEPARRTPGDGDATPAGSADA